MNRHAKVGELRARLRSGGHSVGSWMQIPHASVGEIMGHAGYDWIAVDLEHGAIDVNDLPDLFRALELGETLPFARLAKGDPKDCKQALDAGAAGVIIPMVEHASRLMELRDATRWPPAGSRGVGFSRANLFGKNFHEYAKEAQSPFLVAMIENATAIDDLASILEVDGLDAILVGPYDLSASLGNVGEFDSDAFGAAMQRIRALAAKHEIACGVHVVQPIPEDLVARLEQGYRFLAYGIDAAMLIQSSLRPDSM